MAERARGRFLSFVRRVRHRGLPLFPRFRDIRNDESPEDGLAMKNHAPEMKRTPRRGGSARTIRALLGYHENRVKRVLHANAGATQFVRVGLMAGERRGGRARPLRFIAVLLRSALDVYRRGEDN